ncbi:54S ribosomal protein L36 mitochondrial [Ceratocystis platani]|uniref:54S ribosomal protein L36 mitochondrial n=1 Tax=Ceratocystis fimbriata f. sp. platani TaxID=88771 RepID=A0A0F8BL52_CERFI|nr:54S ribosomal protein L36 mitochondrial [Ceratocystis platani]
MRSQLQLARNALLQTSRTPTTTCTTATFTISETLSQSSAQTTVLHQMIQLSDGSTFTARTTSPQPLFRSTKDTRNHPLWQPSDRTLKNVEVDEAGKLAAFRDRFGRGFDLQKDPSEEGYNEADVEFDLGDLISGYAAAEEPTKPAKSKEGKGKGGKK